MKNYINAGAVFFALMCVGDSGAQADDTFNLVANPVGNLPGFTYGLNANGTATVPGSASQLRSGPGALSNGDGNLPIGQQTAPGMEFDVPYPVGTSITTPGEMLGLHSTAFYDTSLVLSSASNSTDFKASGPLAQVDGTLIQPLSGGSFSIFASTDTSNSSTAANAGMLLLSGTVGSSTIAGPSGGKSGSVFSAGPVTFTGGSLLSGFASASGSDAFSLAVLGGGFTSSDGFLGAFSANVTGTISAAVPLPAQFWPGILVLGAVVLVPTTRRYLKARPAFEL